MVELASTPDLGGITMAEFFETVKNTRSRKIGIFGGILWKRKIALVKGKSVQDMGIVKPAEPFMQILSENAHASIKIKRNDKIQFLKQVKGGN